MNFCTTSIVIKINVILDQSFWFQCYGNNNSALTIHSLHSRLFPLSSLYIQEENMSPLQAAVIKDQEGLITVHYTCGSEHLCSEQREDESTFFLKFKEIFPHHSTASHFVCNWMHTKFSYVWCEHMELGRFQYVAVYHKIKLPHYKETNITISESCVWLKWGNSAKTNMFFAAVNDKPTVEICQNDISLSLIISQTR